MTSSRLLENVIAVVSDASDRNGVTVGVIPDDADGFYRAVEPHIAKMGRVAGRLGAVGERDDIVQVALLNAWRNRRQYDSSRGSISNWLITITAHEASRTSRRISARILPSREVVVSPSPDSADVSAGIRRLSERQRLAIDCYYFVGLSIAETAAVMRCSEGTVKSTLADARTQLRVLLR